MNENVKNTLIAVVWALACIPFGLACAGAFYMCAKCMSKSIHYCFK